MRVSCVKENLSSGVSITGNIATRGGNLPILNNILIKTEEDGLVLSSTNLEIGVRCKVRAKIEEPGEYTLPAKLFSEYMSVLPNEKVDIKVDHDAAEIRCGENVTKIKGTPASEFPLLPSTEGGQQIMFSIPGLLAALEHVIFTVSPGEVRPEISGVLFQAHPKAEMMVVVGTDSYRLAERKVMMEAGSDSGEGFSVIVPLRTVQEFVRIFGKRSGEGRCSVTITPNQITFRGDEIELISRLIGGQYPDYTQIIPKTFVTEIHLNRKEFIQAIKAASLFSKSGVYDVHIGFDPKASMLTVESGNTQLGEHASKVGATVAGEAGRITFNYRYVLDGLSSFDTEEVLMKVVDANNPCEYLPKGKEGHVYIVMPIRQD